LKRWHLKGLTQSGFWKHILPALTALGAAVAMNRLKIDQALLRVALVGVGVLIVHLVSSLVLGTQALSELVSGLRGDSPIPSTPTKDETS